MAALPGVHLELRSESVMVRGKNHPAVHSFCKMPQDRRGDGIPVKGGGATAQLVQDNQ